MLNMKIEVVHVFDKFLELEKVWKELAEDSDLNNPFITYRFYYCLLKVFFKNKDLLIFIVKDSEEVIGIAPFFRDGNTIRSINNIHSHYFDFIIRRNHSDVYRFVFQFIFKNYKFKSIYLGDVCSKSGLYKYILSNDCFIHTLVYERVSPVLMVTQSWKEFYSSVSKNFRNNYQKRVNKVNRQGEYQIKGCNDFDELDVFLKDIFDIEKKSWKNLLGRSMFRTSNQPEFYSLLAKVFFENVKIEILYINNCPAAFWISLFYKNSVYQLKNSFVEELKEYSPGIILTVECLKSYFEKKVTCIDYLGVTNSVKSKVSNDSRVAYNFYLYRKSSINHAYIFIKYKVWPKVGRYSFAQSLKNFILRKSPAVEGINRKNLYE